MNGEHYFDWAATAPCDENILRESLETAIKYDGNPSSVHKTGKETRKVLEEARQSCAKFLGVRADQLFFTSGGTESDHIPLLSVKAAFYERQIKGFKKTDFYHLLKIERAFLQGNVSDQIKLADTAVTTCTKKTKPLYQHCFYINKAIGYFYQHDYRNADTNYKKAYSFIKNKKIKSLKLIFDFYRDFLINKVC